MIHRPRYDDWSLPKGKVDPGETEPVTAVREMLRGDRLHRAPRQAADVGELSDREQGIKKVRYWAARSVDGDFTPNDEVDELIWLPVAAAVKQLDYPHDRKVLRRFAKLPADTKTILIVRHGTAGSKSRYKGDDRMRPLDKRGRAQAESLVGQLLAFGADTLYAADRVRCHQTIEPLAEELGVRIHDEPTADRGGLRRRSQARPASRCWRSPRSRRHAGDLHPGQGDPRSDRLVVRARRGAARQVTQPQGQHVGDVVVAGPVWWRPTTSAVRWPPVKNNRPTDTATRKYAAGVAMTRGVSVSNYLRPFLAGASAHGLLGCAALRPPSWRRRASLPS